MWHGARRRRRYGSVVPAGELNRAIAHILDSQMRELGMVQDDVAAATGMDQGTVSRLLRGKSRMDVDQLGALCRALRVKPSAVLAEAGR